MLKIWDDVEYKKNRVNKQGKDGRWLPKNKNI
jgi:hypothetical protein